MQVFQLLKGSQSPGIAKRGPVPTKVKHMHGSNHTKVNEK